MLGNELACFSFSAYGFRVMCAFLSLLGSPQDKKLRVFDPRAQLTPVQVSYLSTVLS